MKDVKKYYKYINLIRIVSCIAVLLYHLNLLKGGYLAVCSFFALTGYLSCTKHLKEEKFSFKKYYKNTFLKIYLPLVVVVFLTIIAVSFFESINWLNLKNETTSVLLGYNNSWQLSANLDYFTRHINSPFMHFWYIAILLQFDLIFPFIFIPLRKLGDNFKKIIPIILSGLLSIGFTIFFLWQGKNQNIMVTYYGTFSRIFSIFFGLFLGFIHSYYQPLVFNKLNERIISKIMFCLYLLILIILFVLIEAKSYYYAISMVATTILTLRLIDYAKINYQNKLSILDKILKSLGNISYQIYLTQYPVIFIFQYINIESYLKIPLIITVTITISYILKFLLDFNKKNYKFKIIKITKYILTFILFGITTYGIYLYVIAKDYSKQMNELKKQLEENNILIEQKQKEYLMNLEKEEQIWQDTLKDLENKENELANVVTNLRITGVGDSVMLGAVDHLYNTFPNGYFDASTSRTAWVVNDILKNLKNKNLLGNVIVFNLGANGDCNEACKIRIINTCEGRDIFWLNVTNDKEVGVNKKLESLASKYENVHIIDWNELSKGHPEYFVADKIHLTETGKQAYSKIIYDSIYQKYLDEYNKSKDAILNEHEQKQNEKITFYGNDLLLNSFSLIQNNFSSAKFITNQNYDFKMLKEQLEKDVLTKKVVFLFDDTFNLTKNEYDKLINLLKEKQIYIVLATSKSLQETKTLTYENVSLINFYDQIKQNEDYLMPDKIHLTDKGIEALNKIIEKNIN